MAEHTCDECGKPISPMAAEDAIHATHEIGGSDGRPLCRKHLDKYRRDNLETGRFAL